MARYLFKEKGYTQFSLKPVIIVVTPINALIDDQISSCGEMNVKAVKLCSENMDIIKSGDLDIMYSSPECLLANSFREVLLSTVYQGRVIGIVVDEVHLVVKW